MSNHDNLSQYRNFIASKRIAAIPSGFDVPLSDLPAKMKEFQRTVTKWSLYIGRVLVAADTGLGKTFMLLAFADAVYKKTGKPVLILCPLGVRQQIAEMAIVFGIETPIVVSKLGETGDAITIINYDRLHLIDPRKFVGVILDEGSILKSFDSKTRQDLTEKFRFTPYKAVYTATPAPNDYMELGNYAEFLNVMNRNEMLSMFFVHDGGDTSKWRLRKWAGEKSFWEWMASWAIMFRKPSDLGSEYSDEGYILPPLNVYEHVVDTPVTKGHLFQSSASGLKEQREARRQTTPQRIAKLQELLDDGRQALVWCNLNDESKAVTKALEHLGAMEITGSQIADVKEARLFGFAKGDIPILVTKPEIAGHGMNWQNCNQEFFLGLSHSYEQFYQAVRRCWRFGQKLPVDAHVIVSDRDDSILANIKRKQTEADAMAAKMVAAMSEFTQKQIGDVVGARRMTKDYKANKEMELPKWLMS